MIRLFLYIILGKWIWFISHRRACGYCVKTNTGSVPGKWSCMGHYSDVIWASWRSKSSANWIFVQLLVQAIIKENIKAPHYWPFVWGIHRRTVDSPYKGPVMRKGYPCHNCVCVCVPLWGSHASYLHGKMSYFATFLWPGPKVMITVDAIITMGVVHATTWENFFNLFETWQTHTHTQIYIYIYIYIYMCVCVCVCVCW